MNIFDLDNTLRVCDSLQVRMVCGNPSSRTWAKHRDRLGIGAQKLLTVRESFLLWVSLNLSRAGKRKLSMLIVAEAANKLLQTGIDLHQFKILAGVEGLEGRELPRVISEFKGRSVTTRTLYRWGKKQGLEFSARQRYSPAQVRQWLAIA